MGIAASLITSPLRQSGYTVGGAGLSFAKIYPCTAKKQKIFKINPSGVKVWTVSCNFRDYNKNMIKTIYILTLTLHICACGPTNPKSDHQENRVQALKFEDTTKANQATEKLTLRKQIMKVLLLRATTLLKRLSF
jgi:hypothetical protein